MKKALTLFGFLMILIAGVGSVLILGNGEKSPWINEQNKNNPTYTLIGTATISGFGFTLSFKSKSFDYYTMPEKKGLLGSILAPKQMESLFYHENVQAKALLCKDGKCKEVSQGWVRMGRGGDTKEFKFVFHGLPEGEYSLTIKLYEGSSLRATLKKTIEVPFGGG